MSAPETSVSTTGPARKYVEFSHSFEDPWGADGEETEVKCTYRFAKPNKMQIKRLQDTAGKNAANAARNLVLDTVHPDDKDALVRAMEDYPGLATTLSGAILKGVGISNELGK